ncbi:hypothetical protein V2J09_001574 [Rumex salicifolius]
MVAAGGFLNSRSLLSSTTPYAHSLSYSLKRRCRDFRLSPPPYGIRSSVSYHRWATLSRLESSCTRCSITNADVQLQDVALVEESDEDVSSCLTCANPIIHLNSEILEAKPLNLLTEGSFVDSVLTSLPVLTEEEQNALAATPAHPAGLYALYANCLAGNLVEQLWNFAWPAAVALIHSSLLPVAIISSFTKLVVILGGPLVGKLMDHFPRVLSYNCLSFVQAFAQLLSVAMLIHAHTRPFSTASCILVQPWFLTLVLASAVERLMGLVLGVAMERDWVVLLAGTNRPIALSQANSVLSRIDLLCEILGASLFGIFLSKYDPVSCLRLAAGLMIWALPVVMSLTWLTNMFSAGVLDRAKCQHTNSESWFVSQNIVDIGIDSIKHGWAEYLQQPVLPASVAYVLLYSNIVLAPGELMTAFLTQHGLNSSIIGGFSGVCAFMGVAATFISATLVRRFGILKAGAAGLIFQASLLTLAVAVYWSGSLAQGKSLIFLCLIVLSRLGHMSYDVVGAQILQTGIPSSKANLIGTMEVSVASLAEFIMLCVAIVVNDISHFGFLATLSLVSVIGAASVFCGWLYNPTDEQRKLFSFDGFLLNWAFSWKLPLAVHSQIRSGNHIFYHGRSVGSFFIILPFHSNNFPAASQQAMPTRGELFCEILLAILLPPLGVCFRHGCCSCEFFICLLLTILGYIPGMIYAIYAIIVVDRDYYDYRYRSLA